MKGRRYKANNTRTVADRQFPQLGHLDIPFSSVNTLLQPPQLALDIQPIQLLRQAPERRLTRVSPEDIARERCDELRVEEVLLRTRVQAGRLAVGEVRQVRERVFRLWQRWRERVKGRSREPEQLVGRQVALKPGS